MNVSLHHNRASVFTKASPPPLDRSDTLQPTLPEEAPKEAQHTDKNSVNFGRAALKVFSAAVALSSVAGTAMAQSPPGVAPLAQESVEQMVSDISFTEEAPLDLSLDSIGTSSLDLQLTADKEILQTKNDSVPSQSLRPVSQPRVGVRFDSTNDFMPNDWTSWLGGPEHKTPDGTQFDDDGWTAEVRLEVNAQKGHKESVFGARLATITQLGSRPPLSEDYQGLRTDLAEIVYQQNTRVRIDGNTTLDYGVGGGVQGIGDLGGEDMQRWWHAVGPAGGRVGTDLQGQQTRNGFRAIPIATAGAKLTHQYGDYKFVASGQSTLPFGRGLGVVGLRAGIGSQVGNLSYEVGGKLDAAWTDAPEFNFHDPTGVRDGLYAKIEYEPGKWGGFYTQLETGGLRNEPVLSFGVRIGAGRQSRLSPFW